MTKESVKIRRDLLSIIGNLIAIVGVVTGVFFAYREEFASAYTAMLFAFMGKNSR